MNRLTLIVTGAVLAGAAVITAVSIKPKPARPPDGVRVEGVITRDVISGGAVVDAETAHNTLVATGIRLLIGQLMGDSSAPYDTNAYLAVGDDSMATDTSMTALQASADSTAWGNVDSITQGANWVRWWYSFGSAEANFTHRGVGLFNDSAGTMLDRARVSFGAKTAADTWRYSVKLEFR